MSAAAEPILAPAKATDARRSGLFPVRGWVGLAFIVAIVALPWVVPDAAQSPDVLRSPSAGHLLGTDRYGRDTLLRTLNGGQAITLMAALAGAISVVLGTALGATAAYVGGWSDRLLMRFTDLLLATPPLLVILVMGSAVPRSNVVLTVVIGLLLAPGVARVLRAVSMPIVAQEFVASAEAAGASPLEMLTREIFPNIRARMVLEWAIRSSIAVLVLAATNYLGVGIVPPSPDWGLALNDGQPILSTAPWVCLAPATAIVLLVIAINVVADATGERWL
ncbi:ABC transporter permease [Actinomadura graeca]|uniref:ABC transporter permease n=1 Tax=Actinomadura graeca TaxID=2750812 RepID=A0ABX8QZN3_9ACTN|nr:ABC transporter permease [Actinomadura graeca]QXJ24269.1 ABC transporter permease [Actinomadura graeca]